MWATRSAAKSKRSRWRREVAQPIDELRALGVEADEDEPLPQPDANGRQPRGLQAEVVEILGVLGADEPSIEVVDPGVVGALEADRLPARLLDDRRPAVTADVVERPDHAVTGADDDERLVVHLGQEVGPGRRRVLLPPDDEPVAPEPALALEVVDRRVVIGPPGQQRGGPVRAADGGDLLGRERGRGHPGGSGQPSGTVLRGSRNGIAAVRAGQMPPSGATISSSLPGSARPIGTHT